MKRYLIAPLWVLLMITTQQVFAAGDEDSLALSYEEELALIEDLLLTEQDTGKLKFFGKIGHWLTAYTMSAPDFMEEEIAEFKKKAFAQVYIEGTINYDTWLFNMLNRVTKARYSDTRETPYLTVDIKFTPTNDQLNDYKVSAVLSVSDGVNVNLSAFEEQLNTALNGLSAKDDPGLFLEGELQQEIGTMLNDLATELGDALVPDLMGQLFPGRR